MTIPTQMSLHGFIATAPELTYGKSDVARFRARVGIEQWRKEADGAFTKLDPQFCDMVLFKSSAERAYARFRAGDQFVASGYVHEYEFERRSEEHTSELQSLMRTSYAVFCLKKKQKIQ